MTPAEHDQDAREPERDDVFGRAALGALETSRGHAERDGDEDHPDHLVVDQRLYEALGDVVEKLRKNVTLNLRRRRGPLETSADTRPYDARHTEPDDDRRQRVQDEQPRHPKRHLPLHVGRHDGADDRNENQGGRECAEYAQDDARRPIERFCRRAEGEAHRHAKHETDEDPKVERHPRPKREDTARFFGRSFGSAHPLDLLRPRTRRNRRSGVVSRARGAFASGASKRGPRRRAAARTTRKRPANASTRPGSGCECQSG